MPDLTLVKLGGSLITDKSQPRTVRTDVIERLAGEIAAAGRKRKHGLLIGHGSGSFGHEAAARHDLLPGRLTTPKQKEGVSVTQVAAGRLHWQVMDALAEAGAKPFSLAPSSCLVTTAGRPSLVPVEAVMRALDLGLTPVVYGDVVLDRHWGAAICSTETLLTEMAHRLRRRMYRIDQALWLGETPGIYDDKGKTIPRITPNNLDQVRQNLGRPQGTDVTGGIALRLEAVWNLSGQGVSSWLLDGRDEGVLEKALLGKKVPGTFVPARNLTRTPRSRAARG